MKEKYYSKGSTLLLAMVVISTVLFAGIGVGTILSRQIRGMATIENEAVAFYVAETVADMMNKEGLEEADCSEFDFGGKDIECESEEKGSNEYLVTVRVGNDYYSFIKKIREKELDTETAVMYFRKPDNWTNNVTMHYALYDKKENYIGEHIAVFKENMNESTSLSYPGYMQNEVSLADGAVTIRAYFCEGTAEEINLCWDGEQNSTEAHDITDINEQGTQVCQNERTSDGMCGSPPFVSYVNE